MDKKLLGLNGVFAVFKPAGETSARTIDRLKTSLIRLALGPAASNNQLFKRLSRQIKVGHGGTLDPMATGVLVVGLNAGCKDLGKYLTGSKAYVAEARFGEHYDTLDRTGKLLQSDDEWEKAVERIPEIISKFIGEAVMQVPPAFSAIHVNGKRAYDLARKESMIENDSSTAEPVPAAGDEAKGTNEGSATQDSDSPTAVQPQREASFDIPPRPVAIHSITYTPLTLPTFRLSVSCGGGCYIRSIIRDIAAEVGTLAHMTELERVKQGIFTTEMCLREWKDLDTIEVAINKAKELI